MWAIESTLRKLLPCLKLLFRWPVHWLTPWWPSCVSYYHKKFCTFCYWSSAAATVRRGFCYSSSSGDTQSVLKTISDWQHATFTKKSSHCAVFEKLLGCLLTIGWPCQTWFLSWLCSAAPIAPFMQYPVLLGKTCEINVNECMSNPCQNNATCVDDVNGYVCECLHGFRGKPFQKIFRLEF